MVNQRTTRSVCFATEVDKPVVLFQGNHSADNDKETSLMCQTFSAIKLKMGQACEMFDILQQTAWPVWLKKGKRNEFLTPAQICNSFDHQLPDEYKTFPSVTATVMIRDQFCWIPVLGEERNSGTLPQQKKKIARIRSTHLLLFEKLVASLLLLWSDVDVCVFICGWENRMQKEPIFGHKLKRRKFSW